MLGAIPNQTDKSSPGVGGSTIQLNGCGDRKRSFGLHWVRSGRETKLFAETFLVLAPNRSRCSTRSESLLQSHPAFREARHGLHPRSLQPKRGQKIHVPECRWCLVAELLNRSSRQSRVWVSRQLPTSPPDEPLASRDFECQLFADAISATNSLE